MQLIYHGYNNCIIAAWQLVRLGAGTFNPNSIGVKYPLIVWGGGGGGGDTPCLSKSLIGQSKLRFGH